MFGISTIIYIALGGFLGAISRAGLSEWCKKNSAHPFPVGTLLVNIFGSCLLGILIGIEATIEPFFTFMGIGFLGAFTTFSTFKLDVLFLMKEGNRKEALVYLLMTYVGGLFAGFTGYLFGQKLLF